MIDHYRDARVETPLADFDGYNLRPAQPEVADWLQADIAAREYEEPVQSLSREYGEMIGTLPVRDPRDELRAKAQAAIDAWRRQVGFTRALADHTVPDGRIDTVLYGLADSAWNLVWASGAYNVLGPDAGKARDVLVREAGRVDDIQHGRRMTNQEHLDALLADFAEAFDEATGAGSPEGHGIARPVAARAWARSFAAAGRAPAWARGPARQPRPR